ncbi:MAG: lipopolysaccharide biosynthesis protein [Prevotellaceae bacterium]|nr:lipopolysaccharide biosynthesis protein [Prevotellaceae bacterium]
MFKEIKRASFKHKNSKIKYYILNYLSWFTPAWFFRRQLARKLVLPEKKEEQQYILDRVNYYNRLKEKTTLPETAIHLRDLQLSKHKVYAFDTYRYMRYFPRDVRFCALFGDITYVPDVPSLVKSRPIGDNNHQSVLFKLNKIRHFIFIKDSNRFEDKKNMLVGRTKAQQEQRVRFLSQYINHPLCNIGQVNRNMNPQFIRPRMTIEEHLKYKFILCLEGNDVASNLKWVMSSNSLAVMPQPKYETWFMEGQLVPNVHYVLIKDDFSDLEERLNYYIKNTGEALKIIENAHRYVAQFKDEKREEQISLLVLDKYFKLTN